MDFDLLEVVAAFAGAVEEEEQGPPFLFFVFRVARRQVEKVIEIDGAVEFLLEGGGRLFRSGECEGGGEEMEEKKKKKEGEERFGSHGR